MSSALEKARSLRRNSTDAEMRLWKCLRDKRIGVKFRRQVPIGPYIVDFISHDLNLIIEVDGGQHADNARDDARTAFLNKEGFTVLRFWNNDVLQNTGSVMNELIDNISPRNSP